MISEVHHPVIPITCKSQSGTDFTGKPCRPESAPHSQQLPAPVEEAGKCLPDSISSGICHHSKPRWTVVPVLVLSSKVLVFILL